ncbi:MAG: DUF2147 domain-containing protein [Desulfobacteraceae bacterium]|nr:DUF2147 domain-containing protein [Desulfobacteraceae bacterium]
MKKIAPVTLIVSIFLLMFTCNAFANAPIIGKWKTIDDETNKPKSIVQIFEQDGKYFGKIIELFLEEDADQNPTCDKCADDDPRKDQPTLGMEIIQNLQENEGAYSWGTILDPKKGKVYKCKLWVDDDGTLRVQGSFLFISRTQTWLPVK